MKTVLKISVLIFGFMLFPTNSVAQLKTYQFEQIDRLQNIQKRKIIVFIHTDWCKFCAAMKNTTFKNKEVITHLNNKFYFIELNAEEKRKIIFNNSAFNFKPNGSNSGIHELAIQLGTINGTVSYPTICILNFKNQILFQYNSFLNAKDLMKLLEKLRV